MDMKTKKSELKVPTWQARRPWERKTKSTLKVKMRRKGSFWRTLGVEGVMGVEEGLISMSPISLPETAVYSWLLFFRKMVRAIQRVNRMP